MIKEIWEDIKGYKWLYQISNLGNVKSLRIWRLLKQHITRDWYCQIELSNKWIRKKYYIHRLVWLSFIDIIDYKNEINHIDGNKLNNNVNNLEWSNRSENTRHCVDILWKNSKPVWKYNLKWELIKIYNSARQASIINNIDAWDISRVCKWNRKTVWWFIFKYN